MDLFHEIRDIAFQYNAHGHYPRKESETKPHIRGRNPSIHC